MNAAQAAFVDALRDESEAATVALRKEVEGLQGAATALQNFGVDAAWSKIEKAADRIVEKSRTPLSKEQAVARALRDQPGLYSDYLGAQNGRLESVEKARNSTAQRGLAEAAEDQLATLVAKFVAAGMSEDEAVDAALAHRPDLVKAAGIDVPEPVEKAAGALAKIEQAAQREMARDRSLSHAQAMSRALGRSPELYSQYISEVNGTDATGDDEPAAEERPLAGRAASVSPLDGLQPRRRVETAAETAQVARDHEHPFYRRVREAHERLAEMARERMVAR